MLKMGTIEQNIIKQALKSKLEVPTLIEDKPELLPGLSLYLDAFFDLDSERENGFDIGMIKWSSIKMYSEFYNFSEDQTERMFFYIRRMDNVRIEHSKEKNKGKK